MAKRKYSIAAGVIYTGKKQHRRVVSSFVHIDRGTRVVYSTGGDALRECGYLQFRRWATKNAAKKVKPQRTPVLRLARASA